MSDLQLCRGLLVRNHELGFTFLGQLFTVFSEEEDDSLAREVALALTIIAEGDGEGILSKKNHAVLRVSHHSRRHVSQVLATDSSLHFVFQLLHKQKFFNFVLPKIIEGYTASQGELPSMSPTSDLPR